MESAGVKVESVERRDSACCYVQGDGNDLRVRAQAGQPERGTLRFWLFLRAMCKRRMSRPDRNRCRSPKAEQDNGNTALSLKPTDATKRSQTQWSGTDGNPERATCSGVSQKTFYR